MKRWLAVFRSSPAPVTLAGAGRFTEVRQASQLLLWVILTVFAVLLVWAAFAEVETVTRADGKVIPSGRLQVVQSLEGGILQALHVRQGDVVRRGDELATLSAAQFQSDLNTRSQQVYALQARVARFKALAEGRMPVFESELKQKAPEFVANELAAYLSKKGENESQLAVLEAQISQRRREYSEAEITVQSSTKALAFARDERAIVAKMVARGLEPQLELVRIERVMADAEGRAETARVAMSRIESAIQETEARKQAAQRQFRTEALAELNKALSELRIAQEGMPALRDKVDRTDLRSPVDGVVNRILVSTLGGVVRPGEPVLEVVPADDQLVLEALVDPRDIAFIKMGHPAKVKITAYDYSIYGALEGAVAQISADAVPVGDKGQTFYQVRVETKTRALASLDQKLPILPGMQAQVDIITGSKTVLQYLTKPLVAVKENAFRER